MQLSGARVAAGEASGFGPDPELSSIVIIAVWRLFLKEGRTIHAKVGRVMGHPG